MSIGCDAIFAAVSNPVDVLIITSIVSNSGDTTILAISALVSYVTFTMLSDGYPDLSPPSLITAPPPPPPPALVDPPVLAPPVEAAGLCVPTVNGESDVTVPDTLLFILSIVTFSTVTHFPPV